MRNSEHETVAAKLNRVYSMSMKNMVYVNDCAFGLMSYVHGLGHPLVVFAKAAPVYGE